MTGSRLSDAGFCWRQTKKSPACVSNGDPSAARALSAVLTIHTRPRSSGRKTCGGFFRPAISKVTETEEASNQHHPTGRRRRYGNGAGMGFGLIQNITRCLSRLSFRVICGIGLNRSLRHHVYLLRFRLSGGYQIPLAGCLRAARECRAGLPRSQSFRIESIDALAS